MSQKLEEQIVTIDNALGERMIAHVLVIVRSWLNELGENNPYEEAYDDLGSYYDTTFNEWLSSNDPAIEQRIDRLNGDAYRLVDAVYAALRLKRGLSPDMRGFNPDNPQSVMQYFSNCLRFSDHDYQWISDQFEDPDNAATALLVVSALSKNVRQCFNEKILLALIEGIHAPNEVVAEQCLANILVLFVHYDIRIDFFPALQEAFVEAVDRIDDNGEQAFQTLCALVRSVQSNWKESIESGDLKVEDLPNELQQLLELTGAENNIDSVVSWMPTSEMEYMQGIVDILPSSWIFETLIGDSEERAVTIAHAYLSIGRMDLLWEHIPVASKWLVKKLRDGSGTPVDYINYGHCLLLQGDRMLAFENYRQARQMCTPKEFFSLFRPDRRQLVDHGIPVEQVYLLEDNLINL